VKLQFCEEIYELAGAEKQCEKNIDSDDDSNYDDIVYGDDYDDVIVGDDDMTMSVFSMTADDDK